MFNTKSVSNQNFRLFKFGFVIISIYNNIITYLYQIFSHRHRMSNLRF